MRYNNEEIISIGGNAFLNINWEMVSHCQFDCSYCYYKPFQSDTNYTTLGKIVLTKLKQIKDDFIINLIGGEPSLHPDFIQIINELIEIENLKEIRIVTNFVKPFEFWNKIKKSSKVKITASYHPEYPNKDFTKKLSQLTSIYRTDTAFLITNEKSHLKRSKEVFQDLYELSKSSKHTINPIRLHSKEGSNTSYQEYEKDIEAFITSCESEVEKLDNQETATITTTAKTLDISKPKFMANNFHALKGWKCDVNAFIIQYDGMVSYACKGIKKHILTCNFKTSAIICPFKYCECDDYWDFKKVKA
ncbi:4Fe-4S single cluster domain protein [Halobacteriovorax sp. BALOs_7]|uniref:radical SAM protein n=1 Tax=Halobacteriovorax sp. BALOs_7 TaxID=2109558 RepID=UPI000EA11015|nr:radical SAM protein [Halobacteriovorax sp. BALOs_7]AYF45776.1 4Fe-4S single cluster domain protein [Halobacteriovorax sp. BALOs_7]